MKRISPHKICYPEHLLCEPKKHSRHLYSSFSNTETAEHVVSDGTGLIDRLIVRDMTQKLSARNLPEPEIANVVATEPRDVEDESFYEKGPDAQSENFPNDLSPASDTDKVNKKLPISGNILTPTTESTFLDKIGKTLPSIITSSNKPVLNNHSFSSV